MKRASRIGTAMMSLVFALGCFINLSCAPNSSSELVKDGVRLQQHTSNVEELGALLPFTARGAVAVDFDRLFSSDASQTLDELLNGNGLDEACSRPFHLIKKHSLGMDIAATQQSTLLVQTTNPRDGSLLLSKIRFSSLEEIPGLVELENTQGYKGHAVYLDPSSNMNVALLPERLLVVAKENALHSVIDLYTGAANTAANGPLGPYLVDLNQDNPITVVVGMPAMYKEVKTGITLKSSVALSLRLQIAGSSVSGEAVFYMAQASQFATTYNQAMEMYNQPPVTVIGAANGKENGLIVPISDFALDKNQNETIASRIEPKRLFQLMQAKDNIAGIVTGETQPWKNFFVKDYPPSIFINWEIPESQVEEFSATVLPEGFEMMKIRILETDEPAYYLVLNAYTATGLVQGVRQEWSVFVRDPVYDKPRFMVIEALTGAATTHVHEEGHQLVTQAHKRKLWRKKHYFTSKLNWPQNNPTTASSAREFVSANDYIFWTNSVADRGLYAGGVYNRDVTLIPPGEFEIVNDTPWAQFINSQPKSVYVYQNELDILVAMWANLDAPYLVMPENRRKNMIRARNALTTRLMNADVTNAFKGKDHVILGTEIDNSTPSAFFSFRIDESKIAAFESNLGLPTGFHLEKTKILESDSEQDYYLTLSVFETKGALEGTRAEWCVYINDGSGREHVMVIDLMTQDLALEPVAFLNLPSVVEHEIVDGMLNTRLISSSVDFSASIPMSVGVEVLHTTDWVEAREFVCFLNGICDKFYVDGGSLTEPMVSFDPQSISLSKSTPWSSYIESVPASVLVRTKPQILAKKPWFNVMPE